MRPEVAICALPRTFLLRQAAQPSGLWAMCLLGFRPALFAFCCTIHLATPSSSALYTSLLLFFNLSSDPFHHDSNSIVLLVGGQSPATRYAVPFLKATTADRKSVV